MSYEHSQRILKIIIDSINQYNNYRAPEAYAELIEFKGNYFTVRFTGRIFSSCCFYDYFEDLKYILINYNVFTNIIEVLITELGGDVVVKYEVISYQVIT
jgi:hypothetical protein